MKRMWTIKEKREKLNSNLKWNKKIYKQEMAWQDKTRQGKHTYAKLKKKKKKEFF